MYAQYICLHDVLIVSSNRIKFREHTAGGNLCSHKFPDKFCKVRLEKYHILRIFFQPLQNDNFYETTDTTRPDEAHILHILRRNIVTFCKIAFEILQRLGEKVKYCPEFSQVDDNFLHTFLK
jgi:hypothetical protein